MDFLVLPQGASEIKMREGRSSKTSVVDCARYTYAVYIARVTRSQGCVFLDFK